MSLKSKNEDVNANIKVKAVNHTVFPDVSTPMPFTSMVSPVKFLSSL